MSIGRSMNGKHRFQSKIQRREPVRWTPSPPELLSVALFVARPFATTSRDAFARAMRPLYTRARLPLRLPAQASVPAFKLLLLPILVFFLGLFPTPSHSRVVPAAVAQPSAPASASGHARVLSAAWPAAPVQGRGTGTGTGTKVLLSNDDGWATANIRALYAALGDEGYNVVLSAPAENESGTGSLDIPPILPVIEGCEFDSCPPGSPPTGSNESDPRLNYVNSFPVTSARLGITEFGPIFFDGGDPDIVLTGPNVGSNTGLTNLFSGTVGAAATAACSFGIPAVATSGGFDTQTGYTTLSTPSDSTTAALLYAQLSSTLLSALLAPGFANATNPILPAQTILNVNYPDPSDPALNGSCNSAEAFQFVLTRAIDAIPLVTPPDVATCGSTGDTYLPTESSVVSRTDGCFASVTVLSAITKLDASADAQGTVLQRLGTFLSCP